MSNDSSHGEVYGANFFNWALIAGAAFILLAAVTNFAPSKPAQASAAPIETVVVTAHKTAS